MKKVTIVGVGALGSHLAMLLRNHAALKVVDFDRIETKNVMSQLHSVSTVGKNKAKSLQQVMKFLFGTQVEAVPHRLDQGNAKEVLGGSDLVVDCVDDGPTRRIIQAFCIAEGMACLHGALAAGGAFAQVTWTEEFIADDRGEGAATCEDGEHLPFIVKTAAQIAVVAQDFLRKGEKSGFHVQRGPVTRI